MNEFLKNLRSGMDKQKQHQTRYRRSYDQTQSQYRGTERRSTDRRNKDSHIKVDFLEPLLNDLIASIRQLINESVDVRNNLEERKTLAIEQIAENLKKMLETAGEAKADDAHSLIYGRLSRNRDVNRDRVLQIIKEMRSEGATYDQIALQLETENLPTFSGRGKWHAQTVHRIHSHYLDE